jgi:hypothetical protein
MTPGIRWNIASVHQKQPAARVMVSAPGGMESVVIVVLFAAVPPSSAWQPVARNKDNASSP